MMLLSTNSCDYQQNPSYYQTPHIIINTSTYYSYTSYHTTIIITTGHPIFMICRNIINHIILLSDSYVIIKQMILLSNNSLIIKHLILLSTLQPIILKLHIALSLSAWAALAHCGVTGRALA